MKKKVGILTMPVKENYGGIIQAAALYCFLEKEGYQPYLIMKKYDESFLKRSLRYMLSHNPFSFLYDIKDLTKREKQNVLLKQFIEDFFTNKTKVSFDIETYKKSVSHLDTIIVGSDQVWRYNYVRNNYPYYFLAYLPNHVNKIAYAASFGVNEWEGDSTSVTHITKFLKNFSKVSVREKSGIEICKTVFKYNEVEHVLDPTFLLDISFYDSLIGNKKNNKKISLFSYVLDHSMYIEEVLLCLEEERKLERTLIELTDYSKGTKPSVEEWLYHFKEAEYVVTDSFHGVVFCILFQKQFLCVANKERGLTRFESLLGIFNLQDRIVTEFSKGTILDLSKQTIDYSKVNIIINEMKEKSKNLLLKYI